MTNLESTNNVAKNLESRPGFLNFIAYLQIIGIILVVFGHSFHEYPDGQHGSSLFIYRLLYNVRMPLFTFVSGYLMAYTMFFLGKRDMSPVRFGWGKVKRLLLPFFVLTLVTFVPRASMSGMADDAIGLDFGSFWRGFIYEESLVIPPFWFLQMSFILLTVNYAIIYFCRHGGMSQRVFLALLVVIFMVVPELDMPFDGQFFSFHEAVRLGIYFVLGVCYCHYSDQVNRFLHIGSVATIVISGLVWVPMFIFTEDTDLMRLSSVVGMVMFVSVAKLLDDRHIGVLDHMIGANYMIFLLSWYVNVAMQQVLHHFTDFPWWVYTALSLVGGVYIPYLGYRYLVSHPDSRWVRVTAFLLGQNLRRRK